LTPHPAMPPRNLLAKLLAQRKASATATAASTVESKESGVASAAAAARTPATATSTHHADHHSESESDSDSTASSDSASSISSDSASSSPTSPYVTSEDETEAGGVRQYRVFLCPVPASCAKGHAHTQHDDRSSVSKKPVPGIPPFDPFAPPPPPPTPCSSSVVAAFRSSLMPRLEQFGQVINIDIQSKTGFIVPDTDDHTTRSHTPKSSDSQPLPSLRIPKGMRACRDCLACQRCRPYCVRHFAYVDIKTTKEQVTQLLSAFNRSKWRGEHVRAELASPDCVLRARQERRLMKKLAMEQARTEEEQRARRIQMNNEPVHIPQGSMTYEWKTPSGSKVIIQEHASTTSFPPDVDESITPLPLSQLDWSEPPPPARPKPQIDYALLAAVFSGLSSAPTLHNALQGAEVDGTGKNKKVKEKKRKPRDEEDEWRMLETEQAEDASANAATIAAESTTPVATAVDAVPMDEEDEWAALERGEVVTQRHDGRPHNDEEDDSGAQADIESDDADSAGNNFPSKDDASSNTSVSDAEKDEHDMDAEFATLEQSNSDNEFEKSANASTSTNKPSHSDHSASADVDEGRRPKVTSAASWFGDSSDHDENNDDDDNDAAEAGKEEVEEEEGDSDEEDELNIRHAFQGKKGSDLVALERSYGGDDRFKLDARFQESDDEHEENQAATVTGTQPLSADVARNVDNATTAPSPHLDRASLPPALASLSSDEFLHQHVLAEKRRALSILDDVAARPGYQSLTLGELNGDNDEDGIPEHSNITPGQSLKTMQILARGGNTKGRRKPDAHYRAGFEGTMEEFASAIPATNNAASNKALSKDEADAAHAAHRQVSESLLKWMPVLTKNSAPSNPADALSSSSASTHQLSVADRIRIEAEDEEMERRKKLRFFKDVQRFDPTAEEEEAKLKKKQEKMQQKENKRKEKERKKQEAETNKTATSHPSAARLTTLYTPQPAFDPSPCVKAAPTTSAIGSIPSFERDGDKLYDIKTDRLRNLFGPSSSRGVSFAIAPEESEEKKPTTAGPLSATPAVVPFKFGFGAPEEDEEKKEQDQPVQPPTVKASSLATLFTSSPSTSQITTNSSHVSVENAEQSRTESDADIAARKAAAAETEAKVAAERCAAVLAARQRAATALRASSFVQQLVQRKPTVTATKPTSTAAVASASSKPSHLVSPSSDSDSDSERSDSDSGDEFMRSSSMRNDDALTSAWLASRQQHTQDFKAKNRAAIKKSGKNAMGSGAKLAGGKRSANEMAREVLEQSEGKKGRR